VRGSLAGVKALFSIEGEESPFRSHPGSADTTPLSSPSQDSFFK